MIDALLPPTPGGSDDDALFEGIVATAPDADGHVEVVIPAFDPSLRHGPCPVMPRGGGLPERGDRCLVAFGEDRAPWVVAWDGPIGGVPGEGGINLDGGSPASTYGGVSAIDGGLA